MKEYILIGLEILCKSISNMSLRLTTMVLKYLGIVIVEDDKVYGDNS
ncbi:MAG: hypothetical protein HZC10_04535 [Nitrospirae bacterium]|nr:hypothetical protein [Nitrospirota bacterium]